MAKDKQMRTDDFRGTDFWDILLEDRKTDRYTDSRSVSYCWSWLFRYVWLLLRHAFRHHHINSFLISAVRVYITVRAASANDNIVEINGPDKQTNITTSFSFGLLPLGRFKYGKCYFFWVKPRVKSWIKPKQCCFGFFFAFLLPWNAVVSA